MGFPIQSIHSNEAEGLDTDHQINLIFISHSEQIDVLPQAQKPNLYVKLYKVDF